MEKTKIALRTTNYCMISGGNNHEITIEKQILNNKINYKQSK